MHTIIGVLFCTAWVFSDDIAKWWRNRYGRRVGERLPPPTTRTVQPNPMLTEQEWYDYLQTARRAN